MVTFINLQHLSQENMQMYILVLGLQQMWQDMKGDLSVFYVWKLWQLTVCNLTNLKDTWRHYIPLSLVRHLSSLKDQYWLWPSIGLNINATMLHKTAILVKPGHILWGKCPLGFPLMSCDQTTTRCRSCSFGLQAAYMLHSGTSVNHRVEAEQS